MGKERGSPRTTWLDNIKSYGKKIGKLVELNKITEDQMKWREFIEVTPLWYAQRKKITFYPIRRN